MDYAVTKGAVLALPRALAKEVGPSGIRVNAVSPATILTDMTAHLPPETLAELAEETPLGRNGTPEDVAEAVRFLASDRAAFITGQDLPVNGGFLCVSAPFLKSTVHLVLSFRKFSGSYRFAQISHAAGFSFDRIYKVREKWVSISPERLQNLRVCAIVKGYRLC